MSEQYETAPGDAALTPAPAAPPAWADYPVASQPFPAHHFNPGVVNKIGKTRNPWGVWLLTLVTLGIYGLWWYYTINRELRDFDHQIDVQPGLSLCALLFGSFTLGIATIVSIVRTAGRIARGQRLVGSRSQCSGVVGFLLWCIGFGTVYYQSQLNTIWAAYGSPEPGTLRP